MCVLIRRERSVKKYRCGDRSNRFLEGTQSHLDSEAVSDVRRVIGHFTYPSPFSLIGEHIGGVVVVFDCVVHPNNSFAVLLFNHDFLDASVLLDACGTGRRFLSRYDITNTHLTRNSLSIISLLGSELGRRKRRKITTI
jgi:hypothetical protein